MIKIYPAAASPGCSQDGAIKPGDELDGHRARTASSRCAPARPGGCCSSAAARAWRRSSRCCARWRRRASSARRPTTTARARRPTSSTWTELGCALPGDVRRRAVGGQQRLGRRDRADHRSRRPPGGRHRRGRRLRLRPAADGRGGDRAARAPRASPRRTSISTSSRPPRTSEETAWRQRSRNAASPSLCSRTPRRARRSSRPGRAAATTTSSRASAAPRSTRTSRSTSSPIPRAT